MITENNHKYDLCACGQRKDARARTCYKCYRSNRSGENNPNWRGGPLPAYEYKKRSVARHPEHAAARDYVQAAIRRGEITRQPCEVCGSPNADAHHEDYSKPDQIKWLCETHHREAHNGMGWKGIAKEMRPRPQQQEGINV